MLDRLIKRNKPHSSKDEISTRYIHQLYQHAENNVSIRNSIAETSGEILLPGINKILSLINIDENDHFMDLGSGTGKVVLHFFLRSLVRSATGIEIVGSQYEYANSMAAHVHTDIPASFQPDRSLTFIHGDFLIKPFHTATILLIASPCFTPSMLDKVADIINHHLTIHTVISLRPLIRLERLACKRVFSVACSWDTSLCYLYG